ncbi:MAG: hypothetical protein K6G58_10725 [Lachnospiraceae bacterium]|nr:hypothetical protein [Lachnospiraceae bacterium]
MTGYSGEEFRKITGIGSIGRSGPDSGGSGGMYRDNRRQKKDSGFADILAEERSTRPDGTISVRSTGYGPKGLPQTVLIKMKDYTFQ